MALSIFPGYRDQPSAKTIALHRAPIDRLLKSRPDLYEPLSRYISEFEKHFNTDAAAYISSLNKDDRRELINIVAAAYYLDPQVQNTIGYPGQRPQSVDKGAFDGLDLLLEVMNKPKRYRDCQ